MEFPARNLRNSRPKFAPYIIKQKLLNKELYHTFKPILKGNMLDFVVGLQITTI